MMGVVHNAIYKVSSKIIPLVPGKKIFKGFFTIYGHGGYLDHVTSIILINFHFHVPKSLHVYKIWLKMAQWFLRNAIFNFHMEMTLGQGQEMK